jgi:hypothetical protein
MNRGVAGPEPIDDWSTRIETWASSAHSAPPMPTTSQEERRMTMNEAQPGSGPDGARRMATDRAVEAGERLLEAGSKIGNAYADAYQEAVISMADFREKLAEATPADWRGLTRPGAQGGPRPLAKPMGDMTVSATLCNEQILAASKQLGLAYLDACEQAMLSVLDMQEQAATASENEWLPSVAGSTGAADIARDVTRAYVNVARQLLG